MSSILDVGLAALVLAVAAFAIGARTMFAATSGFIAYGLSLALVWVRLSAPDVALAEVSVGAVTGVLLLSTAARLRASEAQPVDERSSRTVRVLAAGLCAAVSVAIGLTVLSAPTPAPTLAPAAAERLHETGLGNPVTAVLMAYRAIDTLLEKIVLLVALVGSWSLAPDRYWGGRPGASVIRPAAALGFLARLLPPIGIVIGVYVVWNSADEPGGAFQGGTLLAAMWIVVRLAGLVDAPAVGWRRLRVALVAGPLVFLAVGFAGFVWADHFLAYPAGWAKPLILAIEAAMTLTVATNVAMLVEGPPAREPGR
jgi:multisubunit Na+/H+ antiporter MnhB subunit